MFQHVTNSENVFELLRVYSSVLLLYFAEIHYDIEHKYRGSNPFLITKCDMHSFQNDILSYLPSSPENKISCHWAWDSIAVRWNMVKYSKMAKFKACMKSLYWFCSVCNTKPIQYFYKCTAEYLAHCILYSGPWLQWQQFYFTFLAFDHNFKHKGWVLFHLNSCLLK